MVFWESEGTTILPLADFLAKKLNVLYIKVLVIIDLTMERTLYNLEAMIVDDEKDLCLLLQMLLAKEYIHAHIVHTLSDAHKALYNAPGLIFLDNQLPDGMGIDFIQNIRQKLPLTKVVLMTAYNSYQDINNAFFNGADAFLAKPFSRSSIQDTLYSLGRRAS